MIIFMHTIDSIIYFMYNRTYIDDVCTKFPTRLNKFTFQTSALLNLFYFIYTFFFSNKNNTIYPYPYIYLYSTDIVIQSLSVVIPSGIIHFWCHHCYAATPLYFTSVIINVVLSACFCYYLPYIH